MRANVASMAGGDSRAAVKGAARDMMTDALAGAGATVRRRRRLRGVGRGVHVGWSEAGTFVCFVFLVQAVLNL